MLSQAVVEFGARSGNRPTAQTVPTGTEVLLKVHNAGVCHSTCNPWTVIRSWRARAPLASCDSTTRCRKLVFAIGVVAPPRSNNRHGCARRMTDACVMHFAALPCPWAGRRCFDFLERRAEFHHGLASMRFPFVFCVDCCHFGTASLRPQPSGRMLIPACRTI